MNHSLQGKQAILSAFLAITVFLTGCNYIQSEKPSTTMNLLTESPAENTFPQEQDTLIPADFADYTSIINMYRKIVDIQSDYNEEKAENGVYDAMFYIPGDAERKWYDMVMYEVGYFMPYADYEHENSKEAFGYALKDLNGNGNDELILLLDDYTVFAIFSLSNGNPVFLDCYDARYRCTIDSEGTLYVVGSGGAAYTGYSIYKISQDGSELVLIEEFGTDGYDKETLETIYYRMIDGEKKIISYEEISTLWDVFCDDYIEETTKYSGLVYISL